MTREQQLCFFICMFPVSILCVQLHIQVNVSTTMEPLFPLKFACTHGQPFWINNDDNLIEVTEEQYKCAFGLKVWIDCHPICGNYIGTLQLVITNMKTKFKKPFTFVFKEKPTNQNRQIEVLPSETGQLLNQDADGNSTATEKYTNIIKDDDTVIASSQAGSTVTFFNRAILQNQVPIVNAYAHTIESHFPMSSTPHHRHIGDTSPYTTTVNQRSMFSNALFAGYASHSYAQDLSEISESSLFYKDQISSSITSFDHATVSNKDACQCSCSQTKDTLVESMTTEQVEDAIGEFKEELLIDKMKLSSAIRRRISAADNRTSARAVGCIGAVILVAVILVVVVNDIPIFILHFRMVLSNLRIIKGDKSYIW